MKQVSRGNVQRIRSNSNIGVRYQVQFQPFKGSLACGDMRSKEAYRTKLQDLGVGSESSCT